MSAQSGNTCGWLSLGRSGTAALEFGLAMPFLLILVVGMAEVGVAAYEAMQVKDAAETGVIYASQHATDFAGVANAVIDATGTAGITATPAPAAFCGCPGAAGVTVGDCTSLCPDGSPQGRYVSVSASLTHVPILSFPGFPDPLVLTGRAVVRVQ
jgi:hypothetical protein